MRSCTGRRYGRVAPSGPPARPADSARTVTRTTCHSSSRLSGPGERDGLSGRIASWSARTASARACCSSNPVRAESLNRMAPPSKNDSKQASASLGRGLLGGAAMRTDCPIRRDLARARAAQNARGCPISRVPYSRSQGVPDRRDCGVRDGDLLWRVLPSLWSFVTPTSFSALVPVLSLWAIGRG
jgi:hypothetical protein